MSSTSSDCSRKLQNNPTVLSTLPFDLTQYCPNMRQLRFIEVNLGMFTKLVSAMVKTQFYLNPSTIFQSLGFIGNSSCFEVL